LVGRDTGGILVIAREKKAYGWLLLLLLISGCLPSPNGRLLGRWEGKFQPTETVSARPDDVSVNSPAAGGLPDYPELRVLLNCEPQRFEMTLSRADGSSDRRVGSWKVLEARGSRWLVEFVSDASQDAVRLQIVFEEKDRFTARQVQGDDRLGALQFHRLDAAQ
jgi:hypothetical protein